MAEKYPIGSRAESERLVREWGFQNVYTWSDGRFVSLPPFFENRTDVLTILGMDTTHLIVMEGLQHI